MNINHLKNEILTTLKICKRDQEAEEVISDAHQKLLDEDIESEDRYAFWKEIYDDLGEREFKLLEDEAKSSVDRILKVSRQRIERILEKEKQ